MLKDIINLSNEVSLDNISHKIETIKENAKHALDCLDEQKPDNPLENAIELYYHTYGNNNGGFDNLSFEKFKDIVEMFVEDYGEPKFKVGDVIHKIGEDVVVPNKIEKIENGNYICDDNKYFINIKFQNNYELVKQN